MGRVERLKYMSSLLSEKRNLTTQALASYFEVSQKTIKRDIEYFRDRLCAPIEWNPQRRSYEYSENWDNLRFLDEQSILAFTFIKAILKTFPYIPVDSEDLDERFKDLVPPAYKKIGNCIRYELPAMETPQEESIQAICQAFSRREAFTISYTDAKGKESERTIEPLRLLNYGGKWYTFAHDRHHGEPRLFSLSRMKVLPFSGGAYTSDYNEEEIDQYLDSSYGIFKGKAEDTATLWFYKGAARSMRNQIWHAQQKTREFTHEEHGETLELTLPYAHPTEIIGRALRCGSHCEVRAPISLRNTWLEEIEKLIKLAKNPTI